VAANLTQEQLAGRSGLSVQAISMLERGVRQAPRSSTLEFLAQALELGAPERATLVAAARHQAAAQPPEPRAGIPPDPIAHFVDREAELAALERRLERDGRAAVHGLGGIGKTQLVVRHLHRQRDRYRDGVFWLRADHESSLVGDLASLAWRLGLPEREWEQERQVEAVLRWLREHRRWLLVLDNLEPVAAEAVRRWLPPGLPGHLVATSRAPTWSAHLSLEPLPLEIAASFLLVRTGQADGEAAVAVADTLGRLPLALEQAAAYLETSGRDLASYGDLLRTHLVELMEEGKPEDYPRPVASTWQLSFERMEEDRPAAAALLRLCSFLAPDDLPIGLLLDGASELPDELCGVLVDGVEFDRTIATLRRYSLMERQGDALRVHRLVQAVVRESLGAAERDTWLAAAVRLLRSQFPADVEVPERWPLCARLLSHAQVVAGLAADRAVEQRALGWLLDRAGSYLWLCGELTAARPLMERALHVRERSLGSDHLDTAASLHGLAGLLGNRGELGAARALVERALDVRERALGAEHPDTAESLNRLAGLLWDQGERDAGRSLMERALAIRERVLGPDHTETADSLGNLATMLRDQGDLAQARSLHERAMAIRERVLGTHHARTANSLNSLAMVLKDQGDLAGARALVELALAIREQVLGPRHPIIAFSLDNLALLLRDRGDLAGARSAQERALAIRERALGPEHPLTIQSRRAAEEIAADLERLGGT
jgi:tetratricopeptide (TPR) repeat protein/transcriptional regulator with XRE-family HTH domain